MSTKQQPDTLEPTSLLWSLAHVRKYGDTDLFPVPFEIKAIAHCWTRVGPTLTDLDLSKHRLGPPQRQLVPKPQGGFRVATQLDPLDVLLYTGMVAEAAEALENTRLPVESGVACSYRVDRRDDGSLYAEASGWDLFQESSETAAGGEGVRYVATADIADFYNQISHHRICSALEGAGVRASRAANLERFLTALAGGQSRGIPVGPMASALLAEAVLTDVDSYLLGQGYKHTRYVDDFRFFCDDRRCAQRALHDLSDYLNTAHRLTLHKTSVMRVAEFKQNALFDPRRLEESEGLTRLEKLQADLAGYQEDPTDVDVPDEEKAELARELLRDLFESCVETRPLHLGLARHLLRRARAYRTTTLRRKVLANLDVLAAVMRDTALYLQTTTFRGRVNQLAGSLERFVESGDFGFLPFARIWVAELAVQSIAAHDRETAIRICEAVADDVGLRPTALLAREVRDVAWVRARKETWQNNKPWDRRAIIWAGSILPEDERQAWLRRVADIGDDLDAAVALTAIVADESNL